MKIIFLDIDGVLNCQNSKSSCYGIMGIDDDKVKRLKQITDTTAAKIVLCSSWKSGWEKIYKEQQGYMADYLDRKLKRQRLEIMDKTEDTGYERGIGIIKWLENKKIESFVILDDEDFDYEKAGLSGRVVKTCFFNDEGGLNENNVKNALNKLMTPLSAEEKLMLKIR